MKAEVALRFYEDIVMEHQRHATEASFAAILEELRKYKANTQDPSWTYVRGEIKVLKHNLEQIKYLEFLDLELRKFLESETSSFIGRRMAEKLDSAIADTSDNFGLFFSTLLNLRVKHSQSLDRIRHFISSLRELGIEPYPTPDRPNRIFLVYFPENSLSDISIVKNNLGVLADFTSSVQRSINLTDDTFQLSGLSTSRLKAYIHLGGALAAAFSATVAFSLDSYKSYLEIRTQMVSLASIKVELEEFSSHDEIRTKIASACAEKLAEEFAALDIAADVMLLKASCRQAISMIDKGFDFSISDVSDADGDINAIDSIEAFTIRNARRLTHLTLELAAIRKPLLMIENTSESD